MPDELRKRNMDRLRGATFDVMIIGGGINGAACAAALSGAGLSVALLEGEDFASGSSSHSSNLIWGGIKYLESHEYLLVERLCRSRNRLLRAYPSAIREIRFLTSIRRGFRFPPLFVFLGSVLYWLMGRLATRAPRYLSAARLTREEPLVASADIAGGLEYSDCYLPDNDARFVFALIRRALDHDCVAVNYARCRDISWLGDHWRGQVSDGAGGQSFQVRARVLINACGPWADQLNNFGGIETACHHVFSKGVHLIVDRLAEQERVLAFFASDGRLFFVIPMGRRTCIGTTDTRVDTPEAAVTDDDRDFILENANAVLRLPQPLRRSDIIAERCAVRPLAVSDANDSDDWLELSRRHMLDIDERRRCVSIFGGKLTDCINVGEEVCDAVERMGLPIRIGEGRWYGEPDAARRREFFDEAARQGLDSMSGVDAPEPLSSRFWRRYGESAFRLLERIREDPASAGELIDNTGYTRCEVELAAQEEMIVTLEDFLRRRTSIAQETRREVLAQSAGLREACDILFGDDAAFRYREYFERAGAAEAEKPQ